MEFRTTYSRFLFFSLLVALATLIYSLLYDESLAEKITGFIMSGIFVLMGVTNTLYSVILKENEIEIARKYVGLYEKRTLLSYEELSLTIESYPTRRGKKQRFILKDKQTNKKVFEESKDAFKDSEQVHQQLAKKFNIKYEPIIRKGFFSNKPLT